MDLQLSDKHIVVVGGSYGLGLSIVKGFIEENAIVHIISRNRNESLIKDFKRSHPTSVFFYFCDAINEKALKLVCKNILQNSDQTIDIVISNVGNGKGSSVPVSEEKEWDLSWGVNFVTALNCSRVFSPELMRSKGSLLFVSSIAGVEFIGAPTVYATAKSALITFAKSLSHRLAPDVRVNVVVPGNIWTDEGTWENKMKQDPDAVNAMLNSKVPLKRFGLPEEISNAVLFISSQKSSFITGACLVIDGGQTTSF